MAMNKAIRERIAACAVHGVTYWSDHPERNTFWATTADQQFVEVQIDRPRQTSYLAHKSGTKYTQAETLADIAAQLGYVEPEPAITKHVPREVLAEVVERIVPHRRAPAVVASMITHDPTWLNPFTVEELSDVLGHTAHDEAVLAELNRREETA